MSINRRKFLKIAGLTGLGLSLSAKDFILMSPAEASSGHSLPSSGERLGMAIDVRKLTDAVRYPELRGEIERAFEAQRDHSG